MGFKMKGSAFKLNNVATKSALKQTVAGDDKKNKRITQLEKERVRNLSRRELNKLVKAEKANLERQKKIDASSSDTFLSPGNIQGKYSVNRAIKRVPRTGIFGSSKAKKREFLDEMNRRENLDLVAAEKEGTIDISSYEGNK